MKRIFASAAAFFALAIVCTGAGANDAAWEKLRAGGYTVLIRHATAPGTGDPANFTLGDCSTQRNLSEAGREESRRLGARFREQNVPIAQVLSSRWCRCVDTAQLAFERVTPTPYLDSFFQDRSTRDEQTEAARKRIAAFKGPGNLVMVTHQVNMTALTGSYPGQGEAFVVRAGADGKIELVARIPPV